MRTKDSKLEIIMIDIQKRLDILIALLLKEKLKNDKSLTMKELINLLSSLGLKYTEIANIFGKTPSYISSELTQIKKKKKKGVKNAKDK
jgi:hypothetical protein